MKDLENLQTITATLTAFKEKMKEYGIPEEEWKAEIAGFAKIVGRVLGEMKIVEIEAEIKKLAKEKEAIK